MIINIGIVSGEILELLEQRDGSLEYYEIRSSIHESDDLVLMSLGWLVGRSFVYIMENPFKSMPQHVKSCHALSMFDLVVAKPLDDLSFERIKISSKQITLVAIEILAELENSKGPLDVAHLKEALHESSEIILMSLGWLLREGYVQSVRNIFDNFSVQLNQKREDFLNEGQEVKAQ